MAKKVTVYSTPTCPFCIRAKQFLKQSGTPFEDIDISQDEAAADQIQRRSGQMGVPVIDIDGQLIIGFDKEKIQEALGI